MAIQVDVSLSEESIQIAVEEILSRVQAKLVEAQASVIGFMRKHPDQDLYAVWGGSRWFLFVANDTYSPGVITPNNKSSTWNGLTIEQWSEYRP